MSLDGLRRTLATLLRILADEVEPDDELLPWRVPARFASLDFPYPTPDPPILKKK